MSNQNPPDPTRGHPDKIASNNKVIVLSMKNMVSVQFVPIWDNSDIFAKFRSSLPLSEIIVDFCNYFVINDLIISQLSQPSFKFDSSKSLLTTNIADNSQSIFSFKPQQLMQSSSQISTAQQKIQIQQSPPSAAHKVGSSGTILIRAQPSASIVKSQFAPLGNCSNVKIQESTTKLANVNKEVTSSSMIPPTFTFRNKVPNELAMKTQAGHTLLLQPSSTTVKQQTQITSPVQMTSGIKGITFTSIPPALTSQLQRVVAKSQAAPQKVLVTSTTAKMSPKLQSKLVPIRPKAVDPPVVNIQQNIIIQAPQQPTKTSLFTLPSSVPAFAKFTALSQKWSIDSPVPALTPIQPRIKVVEKPAPIVVVKEENSEYESEHEELFEISQENQLKTPEKAKTASLEERLLEAKRIIEGEPAEEMKKLPTPTEIQCGSEDILQEESPSIETADSSSTMLLCDERIESVSSDVSPNESEKSTDAPVTPVAVTDSDNISNETNTSIEDVKKNLQLELSQDCDKENLNIIIDEDSATDDSSMTESQRQKLQDFEESLIKAEIEKSIPDEVTPTTTVESKPKRIRKPKNPTIIASLGLPYKPSQPSNRKSKVEKKLEFELDFHDPLNKIQWDDGIGGLNNCNKLFGFDEFGLIEVINKRDAMAKLKQLDVKEPIYDKEVTSFKLRKIVDPADHFVCIVCSKLGTIRDFFSPECCSEACLAITKRKTSELNISGARESSSESGITTPVDERKMMFGGEMIPLQQLQQHLLEQQVPPSKRQKTKRRSAMIAVPETKFLWDTYLSAKSVPAAVSLFKNPYPRSPNPFKVGMKLEAIDPENQKLFCVCTIEEKLGYRIKLHFDGFSPIYDFWVNADSPNIFPSGFCVSTNRTLQAPPKWSNKKFDYSEYLDFSNSIGAQKASFPRLSRTYDDNPFQTGMKLEAMHEGKLYVASIIDVLENRVLVEYDGPNAPDCAWMDIHSPYLHPCNYNKTLADPNQFIPPMSSFEWKDFLKETQSKEAPAEFLFFRTRSAYDFEPGLKLEVVDCVNRQLIRPATVLCREEYKIQVIFDGFDISFAFWLDDDSDDIHPINWCEKTNHPIEHPAGFNKSDVNGLCPTAGCRGIGNATFNDRYFHDNLKECPYNKSNWAKIIKQKLPSRVDSKSSAKR